MDDPLSNWIINFMNIDAMLWIEMFVAHNVFQLISTELSLSLRLFHTIVCLALMSAHPLIISVCLRFFLLLRKEEKIMLSISYQFHIHFSRLVSQQFRFVGFLHGNSSSLSLLCICFSVRAIQSMYVEYFSTSISTHTHML